MRPMLLASSSLAFMKSYCLAIAD